MDRETLLRYAAGELTGDEARAAEAWIAAHPEAGSVVARYREIAETVAGDDTVETPAQVKARAKALFEPLPSLLERVAEHLANFVARLVYDSRLQLAGVRSAPAADRFLLTWEAKGLDIDLQAERMSRAGEPDRWHVIGQCAGEENGVAGAAVTLCQCRDATPVATCQADHHGVFTLDVPSGQYEIRISFGSRQVSLPNVTLE